MTAPETVVRYYNFDIVFAEIPGETTLAINIANCPNRCCCLLGRHIIRLSVHIHLADPHGNRTGRYQYDFMSGILQIAENLAQFLNSLNI